MADNVYGFSKKNSQRIGRAVQRVEGMPKGKETAAGQGRIGGSGRFKEKWVKLQAAMHHDKSAATTAYAVDKDDVEDSSKSFDVYPGRFFGFWPTGHIMKIEKFNGQWVPVYPGFQAIPCDLDEDLGDDTSADVTYDGETITVWTRNLWIASGVVADTSEGSAVLHADGKWYWVVGPCPA